MKKITINQFDGGMTNDPRDPRENVCRVAKHFDAFTNKHKLTPYRDAVTGNSSASTHQIANFAYYNSTFWGLGVSSATVGGIFIPRLYQKSDSLSNGTWTEYTTAGNIAGSVRAAADIPAFTIYHGVLYGVRASQYVWRSNPTAGTVDGLTATSTATTFSDLTAYTTVSNFVRHTKDDILYLGYDNKIWKNDAGSATAAAITLPSDLVITQLSEYGNYLAIGCRPKDRGRSKVYLWDRSATLTTLPEVIDWGDGEIYVLEELEGYLVGVSFEYSTASAFTIDNNMMINTRVAFRHYAGGQGAVKFEEFIGFSTSPAIQTSVAYSHQKVNNRIFFPATIPIVTTGYQGIWSIGRNSVGVPFGVTLDHLIDNGTQVGTLYGCYVLGDYMFMAYDISSVFAMDKTNSTSSYTSTSLYETLVNPKMKSEDRPFRKHLMQVGATYEALPSGGSVVVKYRTDGGSWTTIFTETTVGATGTDPQGEDAAGSPLTQGREFEFHIESTGGAEITGLQYDYEVIPQ